MSRVIAAIRDHAIATPRATALAGLSSSISYAALYALVSGLGKRLRAIAPRVVALQAENGPDWALADLAALSTDICCVPLPTFFSAGQCAHVLASAGVDLLLTDRPDAADLYGASSVERFHGSLHAVRLPTPEVPLPPGTRKITFTSGTTGQPKGVCLSTAAIEAVVTSLCDASRADATDRHLSLLPLSTLLENIAGLYVPLMAGARTHLLPGANVGLKGSSSVDPLTMIAALAPRVVAGS